MALDSMMKRFGTLRRTMTKKLTGESKEPPKQHMPMPQSRTAQLRLANTFDVETEVTTCASYTPTTGRKAVNKSTESVRAMNESKDTIHSNEGSQATGSDRPKPKPRPQTRPDRPGSAALISTNTPTNKPDSATKSEGVVSESDTVQAKHSREVPIASADESRELANKAPARPPKKPSQKPPPPARKRGNTMGPSSTAAIDELNPQESGEGKTRFTAGTMPGRPTNAPKTRASASSIFGSDSNTKTNSGQDKVPPRPPPKSVSYTALRAKLDDMKEKAECYNISIGKELRGMRSLSTSGVNGLTVEDNRLRKIHAATLALGKLAEQYRATITGDLERCELGECTLKETGEQTLTPRVVAQELLDAWRTCFMGLEFVHSLEHKTANMSDQRGEIAYKELMQVFGENAKLPESLM